MAVCLELTQHPVVAQTLVVLLAEGLPAQAWELVGPYWSRGVFDQLDLVATVLGGSFALAVLTCLPMERNDESN